MTRVTRFGDFSRLDVCLFMKIKEGALWAIFSQLRLVTLQMALRLNVNVQYGKSHNVKKYFKCRIPLCNPS
jgi:hypothetical protein